jgi:CBS domain-containing protein
MYEFLDYCVADVMTSTPLVIGPRTRLSDAEAIFEEHDFNGLPVVEAGGQLIGMLTKLDLLRAFAFGPRSVIPPYPEIMCEPAEHFMTHMPLAIEPGAPLTRALQTMIDTRHKSLPVVEGNRLVGIVAREDVLRALKRAVAGQRPQRSSASP